MQTGGIAKEMSAFLCVITATACRHEVRWDRLRVRGGLKVAADVDGWSYKKSDDCIDLAAWDKGFPAGRLLLA